MEQYRIYEIHCILENRQLSKGDYMINIKNRTVFTGDNLHILRGIDTESVDLIYLDPPFNSKKTHSAPIGSEAAGAAFKDTWTLSDIDNAWHGEIAEKEPALYQAIHTAEFTHSKGMKSYLIMMAIRLLEMKRVLKETGSIYLHCDPTASHYLKVLMDSIFGKDKYRNEIIWQRIQGAGKTTQFEEKSYGTSTDQILYYAYQDSKFDVKSDLIPYTEEYIKKFNFKDEKGKYQRRNPFRPPGLGERPNLCYEYKGFYPPNASGWTVKKSTLKKLDEEGELDFANGKLYRKHRLKDGMPANNLWTDIQPALGNEKTGYPTQKPLALLNRIIKASSNKDDMVLDPFCGCATACVAAERLNRKWIGIDIGQKSIELVKMRLEKEMGMFYDVIHRTDIPKRSEKLPKYRTHKHTLYGYQQGNCNGCGTHFPFVNLTVDHIIPKSKGGTDHQENLQLLCNYCNSLKGTGTQAELKAKLKRDK